MTAGRVLELLEKNRGRSLSGAEMAGTLGLSRAAVWKAVKTLRNEGHQIDASTNKGYTLRLDSPVLSEYGVRPWLTVPPGRIDVHKVLDSTNETAKALAVGGAAHGDAVIAETQTAGRGRLGRSFAAPPGSGLYISIILRPRVMGLASATWITAAAAVAVCRAVENVTGQQPGVKWVNDVFLGGKKICGILTETVTDAESGVADWAVTGIGINVSAVPDGLADVAGAVLPGSTDGSLRGRLAAELLNILTPPGAWSDAGALRAAYRERLFMLGQTVTVILPGETYQAVALDVDQDGRLIVEKPGGARAALLFGEVSLQLPK